jgi:hypothetical protein
MEQEQPSAQAQTPAPEQSGIQARIDELTAKFRQAEERNQELNNKLLEQAARESDTARRYAELAQRQTAPAPAAPVDPLAAYREQLDPVAVKAIESVQQAMQAQFNSQFQAQQQKYAADTAIYAVRSEAAAVVGLPPEVRNQAEVLMQQWRAQGWNVPTAQDAIAIALGQYQMGQLRKAAPVMQYQANPNIPAVTPGFAPPPAPPRGALPSNFDSLSREQQNQILEQNGVADQPF